MTQSTPRPARAPRAIALAASLAALAALGCEKDADLVTLPATPANDMFRSYVNIGNSIGAGFQSGGITDTTQLQSYAVLFAQQVGTRFAVPLLRSPGCPPPIVNFQTGARLGNGTSATCALRDPSSVTQIINNVAVPGALAADPTTPNGPGQSILTQLILGGKSQVQRALEANPTFVSVEIIGNDLLPVTSGFIDPVAGITTGVTTAATFIQNYENIVNPLVQAGVKSGVLFGSVNIALAPAFFPAAALANPQFKGGLDIATGKSIVVLPNCTGSTSLVSIGIITAIRGGTHPATISCAAGVVPGQPIGDVFVLDAAEQARFTGIVAAYNAFIKAKADSIGFAYYDPNTTLLKARQAGQIFPALNLALPTQPFGPFLSNDPIHPSALGQKSIANDLIDVVNAKYGTTIAKVP